MRSKEQFKAYVYEKANEKRVLRKHNRILFTRGLAAFSLLFIISGVLIYGNFASNKDYAPETCNAYGNENGKAFYYYNSSVLTDSIADDGESETALYAKGIEEKQEAVLDASTTQIYGANTTAGILQSFSYKSDIDDYKSENKDVGGGIGVLEQSEALKIAKEKCTIDYDTADTFYDSEARIWKIVFYTPNTAGGCQTVYLNQDGSVRLIVYGE